MKNVISAVCDSQGDSALLEDTRDCLCRTFVVATSPHAGGPVRMRSFGTRQADPFPASIWQVARATSAAPTYFLPIEINGVLYGDGGTGWNNPTKEAIDEARSIWPDRHIGILLSLGTGLEDALCLNDTSKQVTKTIQTLLRKTSPKYSFRLAVAEYAVKCLTSCELVHQEVAQRSDVEILQGNYYRLNVSQGMSGFGLAEWEALGAMIALTEQYMNGADKRKEKQRIARLLRNPQHASQ